MRMIPALCAVAVLLAAPAVVLAQSTPPAATPTAPPAAAAAAQKPAAGKAAAGTADGTKEKQLTKQQLRMRDCSREAKAKGMKGDPRKQFMKTCLSEG